MPEGPPDLAALLPSRQLSPVSPQNSAPSAHRPPRLSTATCAAAAATGSVPFHRCGLAATAGRSRITESELGALPAAQLRPSLAAVALAMARILDGRVPTPKPATAKVLVSVLDTLHKGSAQGRRGSLALVRTMTEKGNESG